MQCNQVHDIFSDYVTDSLDSAMRVTVENHLSLCSACREDMAAFRRTWADLAELPSVEPPALLHGNIMERLDAERAAEAEQTSWHRALWGWRALLRPKALAVAAAALLVVLLTGIEYVQTQRAVLSGVSLPAPHKVPRLQEAWAQWLPGNGGGTVVVYLHTAPLEAVSGAHVHYTVALHKRQSAAVADQNAVIASGSGDMAADDVRTVMLHVTEALDPQEYTLTIHTGPGGTRQVPIMMRGADTSTQSASPSSP